MAQIKQFHFGKGQLEELKDYVSDDGKRYGLNWPVVYLLSNPQQSKNKVAYVGETHKALNRAREHLTDPQKSDLKILHVITDFDYNQSVCKDLESHLIRWLAGSGHELLNRNDGLSNLDYHQAENYRLSFKVIWRNLKTNQIVDQNIEDIENNILFKYSPYKALTETQQNIANDLLASFAQDSEMSKTCVISGEPGTGKTILATYLVKRFKQKYPRLTIALVIPMQQLRYSLKMVFKSDVDLKPDMAISPYDVAKKTYDILIVDEAHRLKRRVNLSQYSHFDTINRRFNFGHDGSQLDWILHQSRSQILLYDEQQSIQPGDIRPQALSNLNIDEYYLNDQIRIRAGKNYINYIDDILNNRRPIKRSFTSYEFRLFNSLAEMIQLIKEHDKRVGLSRIVAGYSWKWLTKKNPNLEYDFIIDNIPLKWNSSSVLDWPNSENAINEVGCIHTIQGYDLNYAGVIIGQDLIYDPISKILKINPDNYHDFNGKRTASSSELEQYIKNIYKVLLTRAMRGTYIYVVDPHLRQYLADYFF
ncbi:MAG: DUF2075 domain-containing protein [Candidatus Saccharibacteria bacterium]|nr:DUF2075 domain-containing protein [Candidatus Saccharibacteria bacterium]